MLISVVRKLTFLIHSGTCTKNACLFISYEYNEGIIKQKPVDAYMALTGTCFNVYDPQTEFILKTTKTTDHKCACYRLCENDFPVYE
jgi:hypothetical protein